MFDLFMEFFFFFFFTTYSWSYEAYMYAYSTQVDDKVQTNKKILKNQKMTKKLGFPGLPVFAPYFQLLCLI
jgi:hypothetical protein